MGVGQAITIIIPDMDRIKDMTDLPILEDHMTSAVANLWHQARYVKALEERIRELKGD